MCTPPTNTFGVVRNIISPGMIGLFLVSDAYGRPVSLTSPPFDSQMAPQDASMAYNQSLNLKKMWMKKKMLDSSLFLMYDKKGEK